jgi:glyoxylase-like metal-dependent hydrolase (beta-lactamase superfamily II)
VLTDAGPVLIDTRSTHRQAEELRRDLRELTDLPVAAVVNTHRHHDHCFGNHMFRPAPIWSHVRCRSELIETGEAQRVAAAAARPDIAADLAAVIIDPPDRTFEEQAVVDVGGRRLDLRYLGRAHTDGDIVVLVTGTGVLFAGDVLENGAPPWFGDGYPLDWPETASRLLELVTGPVVPGHGDVADRSFVEDQLATFISIAELSRRVHRGELALEEAAAAGPYGPAASREPIERALAQLRGELDGS